MPTDFNFYINRQGARGRQGIQGEQGFSPVVTVNTNTATEYTLNIETIDGVLTTPNLKSTPLNYIAGAGNYVMYDPSTQQIYNSDAPDELVLKTDLATVDNPGIIQIADDEDFDEHANDVAVTPRQLNNAIASVESEIPTNYVTTNTIQTISGAKTFSLGVNFGGNILLLNGSDVEFRDDSLTPSLVFLSSVNGGNLAIRHSGTSKTILTDIDVDNTTIEVNTAGKLHVIASAAPDVIDGGIVYPALKTFTITTSNQDITISDSSVDVTDDTAGTSTISISSSAVRSSVTITINYENNSIDNSSYTLETYNSETGRWISQGIGAGTDVINNDSTTANFAGMTFTLNPDTLTITVS